MHRPISGQYYTAESGDTFPVIATRAYGLAENWTLIRDANQLQFKTDDQEAVQPGEVLFIPPDPVLIALKNAQT